MDYNSYLQTTHWQETRNIKLKSFPHCRICRSEVKLNIHHKFYTNKKSGESILFHERIHQLITLCSSCHKLWHLYCQNKFIDKKGRPNVSKKIMGIRELLSYGVKKQWAFRLVGMGLWWLGRGQLKNFAKLNNFGIYGQPN